ncbi:MAG TPA: MraY family glycosyltransferase [Phycisphaerales bacterium]|nr:MraY family glycosyltransferase [Phycisphaerales bacterium]HMP37885.1 MraY family glycosyltransferase [Phycisphaerales bacterium]
MLPLVLATILVGLIISLPATAILLFVGRRAGALDSPGADGHVKVLRNVPNIGGIAIFLAVALPLGLFVGIGLGEGPGSIAERLPALAPHVERMRESLPVATAMLACLAALHVLGLVDDRRSVGPGIKFAVQFAAAITMAGLFDVRLFTFLDRALPFDPIPSAVLTVLWIVLVTNALNFMDNMDGLAGGVAGISALLFMTAAILNQQWFIAATLGLLIGGLGGFLFFNFPPARIFMGDGGSLVVGFLLGVLTARTTFYDALNPGGPLGGGWYGVLMPVVVLAVPLYDFVTVTLIRLRQGKSPFVGDQQHFSHRLVQRGLTRRGAVLIIWAITAVTGIGGIILGSLQGWQAILVGVQTVLALLVLAALEYASRHAVRT